MELVWSLYGADIEPIQSRYRADTEPTWSRCRFWCGDRTPEKGKIPSHRTFHGTFDGTFHRRFESNDRMSHLPGGTVSWSYGHGLLRRTHQTCRAGQDTCLRTCLYTYMCVRMSVHMSIRVSLYIYMRVLYICVYTRMCTSIHTHLHAKPLRRRPSSTA